ncbi:Gfo/Idh/MocA family protein [Neisseria iguanae]|uniref:Gfo/Idh/MocA family protein n=1 Tax=Neisseria iguanae TaxID=90242 RepID=UPI002481E3C6|nr:Gfo/Idh/MocA family oxidoreductase [Neisseria iguanae]
MVDAEFRFERYAAGLNKKAWKETGGADVGLVYDLGSHLLDMAADIFGMPSEIYADIRHQHEGALNDDNFDIALYYSDGLKVSLIGTKYAREPLPFMTLHGKKGSYIKQEADNQEASLVGGCCPKAVRIWKRRKNGAYCILKPTDGLSANPCRASAVVTVRFTAIFMRH